MSDLRTKSKQNFKAAKLLIDKELFASSVHCSYYGILQFLTCEYAEYLGKSFEEIKSEARGGKGSHNLIITGIINYIKSTYRENPDVDSTMRNVNDTNVHRLHSKIKDIKNFRVKSDYRNIAIKKDDGEKVYNWSLHVKSKIEEFL